MAKRAAKRQPSVERKIYFFRVDTGLDNRQRPMPFEPTRILAHIDRLPWRMTGRYHQANDGRITCCWIDRNAAPHRLRIAYVRRNSLPYIEDAGELSPLDLPNTSGLAEQTHVVFFPDNIAGAEFNYYGPRISRLAYYFTEKATRVTPPFLYFDPLLRQDIAEQLEKYRAIRLLTLKLKPAYVEWIKEINQSLEDVFNGAREAGDADEVEITLQADRYQKGFLSNDVLDWVRRLVRRDNFHQDVSKAIIRAQSRETGSIEELNLLNDKLITKRRIVLEDERFRTVDSESAYMAVEDAYDELKDELDKAIAIGVA